MPDPPQSPSAPLSSPPAFVYPIKSLLTGIQPARDNDSNRPGPSFSSSPSTTPLVSPELYKSNTLDIAGKAGPSSDSDVNDVRVTVANKSMSHGRNLSQTLGSSSFNQSRSRRSHSMASNPYHQSLRSPKPRQRHEDSGVNFSHFPFGDSVDATTSFTRHGPSRSLANSPEERDVEPLTLNALTPTSFESLADPNASPSLEYNVRHPPALPLVASQAFHATSASLLPQEYSPPLPWNPSELGLVHLPSALSSNGSGSHSSSSTADFEQVSDHESDDDASENSNYFTPEELLSDSSGKKAQSLSVSEVDVSFVTVRFEHVQDENGHHVLTGREGKLERCEDEPIRTPGAVQGFGVLIAVEEQEDTLVVRQVSENATELLGLSPQYLFSLECFTDTLPGGQAGLLWDNIQFLPELPCSIAKPEDVKNEATTEDDFAPHVFLLSGYGAPGSALPDDYLPSYKGKRFWTCWCAVHRTQPSPYKTASEASPTGKSLIVLEFELETDVLNPLYPPPGTAPAAPGEDSPMSDGSNTDSTESSTDSTGTNSGGESGGGGNATDESEKTLVSGPMDSTTSLNIIWETPSSPDVVSDSEITPPATSSSTSTLQPEAHGRGTSVTTPSSLQGLAGDQNWVPSSEDIIESTTSRAKPLAALERLRRMSRLPTATPADSPSSNFASGTAPRSRRASRRSAASSQIPGSVGMMDVFAVMAQINEQLGGAPDLDAFLKVVVGVIKDLTQFHRVLVYQFDELWNGQTVAELVDWSQTHDLYKGLHFPASDIPAQARELYKINKVRILYDRDQSTARIVVRNKEDLENPLNMTHCYLRAMNLANMGVRASMSVSIMAFGSLWGLVACHSYGPHGMRVSFPVRQMLRLLSQSISRNIERLSYAQRLHTRKLINTISSDNHPTGYIVSNADDLLGLFDADFGILVIGDGAKILGPNQHGQEILIMAEYLRLKQFNTIQVSQSVITDFLDLKLTNLEVVAGMLYVPLSSGGQDFIAFLRKGQPREVHWAGKPFKQGQAVKSTLEPRKSFKIWSETVAGRCRAWTDEQLETAGVLALVYGKFIEVWRQKENALQTTKLTNLLLSNATHEVRTPLNHIINYLEMALNGPLDFETRHNLSQSHAASKSLLFTINDLLDLTRLESGNETSFNEPFDLCDAIRDAASLYQNEASRRNILFDLDVSESPKIVVGDSKKIRTVVQNLTANALKYTKQGSITVRCQPLPEEEGGLRWPGATVVVEIVVADTGCGIPPVKLESIFREFEQVESSEPKTTSEAGVGLGLAVVARIVEQLGGQLRVESKEGEGSRFSFLIPLKSSRSASNSSRSSSSLASLHRNSSHGSVRSNSDKEIDSLVEALSSNHMDGNSRSSSPRDSIDIGSRTGSFEVVDSAIPLRPIKVGEYDTNVPAIPTPKASSSLTLPPSRTRRVSPTDPELTKLRVLIVEDNDINRAMLARRLRMDGHVVVNTTNGQEGVDKVTEDRDFDCVLMDINMPILDGFGSSERIRELERKSEGATERLSYQLNGRIPIFAVSASLYEAQRNKLSNAGMDGWILKPIVFERLKVILKGVTDLSQRERDVYHPGCNWENGGWLAGVADASTATNGTSSSSSSSP
ncbi:hypothetical protein D9758_007118 [Tetrapyrgos nigripes]|uniref:Phytochrome n=1 Tax=Tetrapyrgos nigripes TaxID=182062 RepID=A0A8H5GDE7_9AGAR|nr:hypothetical protein D9758_007118 [Tetrapyrgos nigripes]